MPLLLSNPFNYRCRRRGWRHSLWKATSRFLWLAFRAFEAQHDVPNAEERLRRHNGRVQTQEPLECTSLKLHTQLFQFRVEFRQHLRNIRTQYCLICSTAPQASVEIPARHDLVYNGA